MWKIPFEAWFIGLVIISHVYVYLLPANSLLNWFHSDDAFYYFKTAQNIAEGYGVTFDRIGRTNGFHPLWMMLIIPIFSLAKYDLILPLRLVVVVSVIFSAGTGVLLYRIAKAKLHPYVAMLAAFFWAFFPLIHQDVIEMGMESGISALMIAWLMYRLVQEEGQSSEHLGRWLITGCIAALTVLARLDNIFLVIVAGVWMSIRPKRSRYLLVSDIFLVVFGVLLSYFLRVGFGPQAEVSSASMYWMAVVALVVRIPIYYLFGLYNLQGDHDRGSSFSVKAAVTASLLATVILSVVMLALFAARLFPGFPRLVLTYEAGFGLVAVLASRGIGFFFRQGQKDQPETMDWISVLKRGVCYFAPLGIVLAVYLGWNQWYFGTPAPVSGQIKRWWGFLPSTIYGRPVSSMLEMLGFFRYGGPWGLLRSLVAFPPVLPEWLRLLLFGGIAFIPLARMSRRLPFGQTVHSLALFPLIIGGLIQLVAYTGTGYLHMRSWYWISHMILITLLLAALLDAWFRWLLDNRSILWPNFSGLRLVKSFTIAVCLTLVVLSAVNIFNRMPMFLTDRQAKRYLEDYQKLQELTEPGALIGSTGGGVIAYFIQDRTIINLDGLMNTYEYFQMLKAGTASEYLDRIGMRYIFSVKYPITSSDPYFQFKGRLQPVLDFGGATLFIWK